MEECEDLLRFLIPAFLAKDEGLLFNFTVLITWLIALTAQNAWLKQLQGRRASFGSLLERKST